MREENEHCTKMVLARSWSERKSRSVTLIRKIRSAVAKGPFDRPASDPGKETGGWIYGSA